MALITSRNADLVNDNVWGNTATKDCQERI